MSQVADKLRVVRDRIALAAGDSGRSAADVTLIAVTKTVPILLVDEAIAAGVRHFGENRVQEALAKYSFPGSGGKEDRERIGREGITLHMIGSLQRNKARTALSLFDVIHSIDRAELAEALNREAGRFIDLGERAPDVALPVLIEVNTTGEESKSGVSPAELPALAEVVARCGHLRGFGLMTIARLGASEAEARNTFAHLRRLLEEVRSSCSGDWIHLSMGMSDDFEPAIREGSTMVRLGRAIFGERQR